MIRFNKKIYVDIAAILDIRQGVLSLVDPDLAVEITSKPSYFVRDRDEFGTPDTGILSTELFAKLKVAFKGEIIRSCVATRMWKFLTDYLTQIDRDNCRNGTKMDIDLVINFWPYDVDVAGQKALCARLKRAIKKLTTIEDLIVVPANQDPAMLTPAVLKEEYLAVIMYDYSDWVNAALTHTVSHKKPLKGVSLFFPRLHFQEPLSEQDKEKIQSVCQANGIEPDVFRLHELMWAGAADVTHLPIAFFCVDSPANREQLTRRVRTP